MNAPQFRRISTAHSRSGLSIAAFCRKQRLPVHSFHYWRRRYGQERPVSDFVEVKVQDHPSSPPAASPSSITLSLLDTVLAGKPADLNLYWGRPQAPDFSFGAAVFSSFAGAWHLQPAAGSGVESIARDASPYATPAAGPVDDDRSGSIGLGAGFRGTQHLKAPGHAVLRPDTGLTVSTWFKVGTDLSDIGDMVSLGDNYTLRVMNTGVLRFYYLWDSASVPAAEAWSDLRSTQTVKDKAWHHVAGVLGRDSVRIYLDGRPVAAARAQGRIRYGLGQDLIIGNHGTLKAGFAYRGQIDEVQTTGSARSRAWIKLAYLSQKPGSNVLGFP